MSAIIQEKQDYWVDAAAAALMAHQLLISVLPHETEVYEMMTQTHDDVSKKSKGRR